MTCHLNNTLINITVKTTLIHNKKDPLVLLKNTTLAKLSTILAHENTKQIIINYQYFEQILNLPKTNSFLTMSVPPKCKEAGKMEWHLA